MSHDIRVTFLGTTSGGGPTETRNCSSLVVDVLGNGSLWMVDCAEGTVRQFVNQPNRPGQSRLKIGRVTKIFITHMHADHTMGTLTFLRTVLGAPPAPTKSNATIPRPNRRPPQVEVYGPRGIRRMLRMLWYTTHTHSERSFAVHELLFPGQEPSVPADVEDDSKNPVDVRRESECVGRDIWCTEDGFWRGVVSHNPKYNHYGAVVDAGPILHRDPCIGYIIREVPPTPFHPTSRIPRKLVILGDTHDPSPLIPLIHADPVYALALPEIDVHNTGTCVRVPVSLLVHEATDAYIPRRIDPDERTGRNRTQEGVLQKIVERGHSTPAMAGAFARRVGAERLVMNHIGARFPAPSQHGPRMRERFREACMREIERQAAEAWVPANGRHALVRPQAAWDYLSIVIPPNLRRAPPDEGDETDERQAEQEDHEREEEDEEDERQSVISVDVEEVDAEAIVAGPSGVIADIEMHSSSVSVHYERGRGRGGRGRGRGRNGRGYDRGGGHGGGRGSGRGRGYRGSGEARGSYRGGRPL